MILLHAERWFVGVTEKHNTRDLSRKRQPRNARRSQHCGLLVEMLRLIKASYSEAERSVE